MLISDYPVIRLKNFFDFYMHISAHKDHIAFSKKDINVTYKKLCNDIRATCVQLRKLSAKHIIIKMKDKYLFAVNYLATVLCGKIAVLSDPEINVLECFKELVSQFTVNDEIAVDWLNKNELIQLSLRQIDVRGDSPCTLLCSSGTMRAPKIIALSEENIISDLIAGMEKYRFDYYGVYVSIIPYFHAFGLVCDLLAPLYACSTIYIPQDKMTFCSELLIANPTALNVSPGIVQILLIRLKMGNSPKKVFGNRLKKILSGGASTPSLLCSEMRKYGVGVYGCYGLSECSPCVSVNRDDYFKDGSAGLPLNCNKIKIAADNEICIKGSNVMLGYYEKGLINKDSIVDGYFHTGDLGYIDEDGFLYITGRKNNLIIFENGVKLMAESVEMDIVDHTEALEAIVTSINKNGRTMLEIAIYLRDMEKCDLIEQYIKERYFNYSIDKIRFTTIPFQKTSTGKIRRG